jgi:hypothetical protein
MVDWSNWHRRGRTIGRALLVALLGCAGALTGALSGGTTATVTAATTTSTTTTLPCPHDDPVDEPLNSGNCSVTIPYTGGLQTYTVPSPMTSVEIVALGGSGGNQVRGTISVTPGEVLTVQDGGQSVPGNTLTGAGGAGAYGGGGAGGSSSPYQGVFQQGGWGGAGATSVWAGNTLLFVAGGSGGASSGRLASNPTESCCSGGSGVGDNGNGNPAAGATDATGAAGGGGGGTRTSPGAGGHDTSAGAADVTAGTSGTGPETPGRPGTGGLGASGGSSDVGYWNGPLGAGGGGGGGYYGGGGSGCSLHPSSSSACYGGGEGSSFASPLARAVFYGTVWLNTPPATGIVRLDYKLCGISPADVPATISAAREPHAGIGGGNPPIPTGCPLKVFVKVVGPIANVGTRSGLAVDRKLRKDGPVNFTIPTVSKTESVFAGPLEVGQKCLSGCANLVVTVIDPATGKTVPSADVTADLANIDSQGFPALEQQGDQFVCLQSDDPSPASCSVNLGGLSTDANGELHLIYWAPGEVVPGHAKLTITATKCSATCTAGQQMGSASTTLTVTPYVIYKHQGGVLGAEAVKSLIDAVDDPKLLSQLVSHASSHVLSTALEWLAHEELLSKHVIELAVGPEGFAVIEALELTKEIAEGFKGIKEEQGIAAEYLKALDLSSTGLYSEPFEHDIAAPVNPAWQQTLLAGLGNLGHIGAGGVLWDLGENLVKFYDHHRRFGVLPERVGVSVF